MFEDIEPRPQRGEPLRALSREDLDVYSIEDLEERIAALERENRELRRANQILKSAASFLAAELDRPSR